MQVTFQNVHIGLESLESVEWRVRIDAVRRPYPPAFCRGELAQMVERLLSMREVVGSTPTFSK